MKWTKAIEQLPPVNRDIFFRESDGSYTIDRATKWDKNVTNYEWADPEDETCISEEDRDMFAINFAAWYAHADDAQIYKQQRLSANKMLELYKSRPYLRTDSPESN